MTQAQRLARIEKQIRELRWEVEELTGLIKQVVAAVVKPKGKEEITQSEKRPHGSAEQFRTKGSRPVAGLTRRTKRKA